jgi:hypothetical protein
MYHHFGNTPVFYGYCGQNFTNSPSSFQEATDTLRQHVAIKLPLLLMEHTFIRLTLSDRYYTAKATLL